MTPVYEVLTYDPELGRHTPQVGCPRYVAGWRGLRAALRTLQALSYSTHRGEPMITVSRIEHAKDKP